MHHDANRILRELKKAKQENNDEVWLTEKEDNIRNWIGIIKGPDGTPYQSRYFKIEFVIPEHYPIDPPEAKFVTPIFHPNVHFAECKICLDILDKEWTPAWSIQTVSQAIRALLAAPEPSSPLNTLAGNLLKCKDYVGFNSMASMYARKYGYTENPFRIE